ncbi:MAG: prolyl oligopeptidase family serine peptidase [Deltaproteobacteria bacterium]|nr:prolyl oligopeptidase family serine peptidase [Deltaproteobacteria bacterium]
MNLARRGLLVSLALVVFACRRAPSSESGVATSPAAASAASSGPTACTSGTVRCVDVRRAERCVDGAPRLEECGASACVEGGCLGPGEPKGDSARLVPLGPRWLDAWTARGPLTEEELATATATAERPFEEDGERRAALCAPDGFVSDGAWSLARAGRRSQLLTAHALVAAETPAELRLSLRGRVRLWLAGSLIVDRESTPGMEPMTDEYLVPVVLGPGRNALAVAVTPSGDEPPGFGLRLGARDGRLLDVAWETTHGERCSSAALVRATLESRLVVGGFAPRFTLDVRGLFPLEARLDASVHRGHVPLPRPSTSASEQRLASTSLTRAELATGASFEVRVAAERAGEQPLRLELVDGPGAVERRSFTLRHHRVVSDRYAELGARFLHGSSRDLRPIELDATLPPGARASFEHELRRMLEAAESGHPDTSWLRARGDGLARDAEALGAGRDPYAEATGVVRRAYRSPLDGRLQPYVLFVPARARRSKQPLPLVVVSHGLHHDAALALRIAFGEGPDEDEDRGIATRHLPHLPDYGFFVLAHGGYRDAGPRTVGEADVLDAIADVSAHYSIDPRRVSLTGYSLGGTVSFTVPLHYPDRFAAAAPLCGYPNLMTYGEVARAAHTPVEELLLARRFIGNYAENGMHLPLHIVHGGNDGPHRSAVIADRYRELGYARTFRIEADLGHNVWDEAYEEGRMLAWLASRRRPERPERVRLRTGELRYDRSYWVRLLAREREDQLAEIDARQLKDGRTIEVTTYGVRAFALDTSGLPVDAVVIDGRRVALEPGEGLRAFVRRDGAFEASAMPDLTGHKRPGVAGPLDDVLRHRLIVVYGTQRPSETESNRLAAEHWASSDSWSGASFPVRADSEVVESDLRGASVVCIGRPETNLVTARFAEALPVRFEAGALAFAGRRFAGEDVGVSLIRPNPLDPDEYLVVHAGVGHRGTLASRHLPRLVPDYVVYGDGLRGGRGGELLGERRVLEAGFFDERWGVTAPKP